jgi:large subunit ribosomal protein L24
MKIKTNDKVKILTGKDSGKSGKVIKSIPKEGKVVVEGLNVVKKHVKPANGQKGQTISVAMPIDISNTILICPSCGKESRVGYKILENGDKQRVCKKCKQPIEDNIKDNK